MGPTSLAKFFRKNDDVEGGERKAKASLSIAARPRRLRRLGGRSTLHPHLCARHRDPAAVRRHGGRWSANTRHLEDLSRRRRGAAGFL